ncbi:MAG: hypothetical protein KC425_17300 [Anaerolineales bacterium]|nr:hypothetical protein [Anaerolineales bacterium]
MPSPTYQFDQSATAVLQSWAQSVRDTAVSPFAAAQQLARRLGAQVDPDTGQTHFGFWLPHLAGPLFLELLTPLDALDLAAPVQSCRFRRQRFPLTITADFAWAVVSGPRAGTRRQIGDFYWLTYQDDEGHWHTLPDPLARSVPFGVFAPAELYDWRQMLAQRADAGYFQQLDAEMTPAGLPRLAGPTNILQLHVGTASADGTLAGLADHYRSIAAKLAAGQPLTPAEQHYVGYDAVQLMPIEPTIEYEAGPAFWQPIEAAADAHEISVALRRPDMTNWGYDVITIASPAPNPALLASGRPDELLDLITTLHTFPGKPIQVIFDVVYGHADNQALPLLPPQAIAGPGMYGQNLSYRQPMLRALLLEMQRRKSDYGVDGLRVDGAQDFKYWDAAAQELKHDDAYLQLMNDLPQEAAGVRYLPWMIFEDGRPWPRDDWELASSYREITKQLPNVVQWGPLTFAHNTPFLFTFWIGKWWRIQEIARVGSHWITGCANHDTLRRGTQVPLDARVNTYLGATLPEIYRNGYDNPAAKLFDYALMPGIPMDFINASMRAPWSFIRNTDDRWGVKVVSEESRFLDWAVPAPLFARADVFARLKGRGFAERRELRRFMLALDLAVRMTGYHLLGVVRQLNALDPALPGAPFSVPALKEIARDWMDDVHDLCNVARYAADADPARAAFNLAVREFRRQRPFLRQNFAPTDHLAYLQPMDGSVLFYGRRTAPNGEQLLFVANMEGAPRTVAPTALPIPDLPAAGWRLALATPGLDVAAPADPLTLHDSQGAVFTRRD